MFHIQRLHDRFSAYIFLTLYQASQLHPRLNSKNIETKEINRSLFLKLKHNIYLMRE